LLEFRVSPDMNPSIADVAARVLIASVFVGLGIERLLAAGGILSGRGAVGVASLIFSGFELVAGMAIMFGWQAGRVALLMAIFLTVDAFVAHPFWKFGGSEQHGQFLHFLKNFSAIGGLLLLSWIEVRDSREPRP